MVKSFKSQIFQLVCPPPPPSPALILQTAGSIDAGSVKAWERVTRGLTEGDAIKSGFFRVDGTHTKRQRVREFKSWVNKNVRSDAKRSRHEAGRKGLRDSLNRLGAMRLRYCGVDFAEAKAKMNFGRPTVYTHERSMRSAADATKSVLHALFDLTKGESPIHFSKGWGNRRIPPCASGCEA